MDPEPEQCRFYTFTQMKPGDDGMKIHNDLKHVYGAGLRFALHCLQIV